VARNPPWVEDELLIVLDLYLAERRVLEEYDSRVVEASEVLNRLPIHSEAGQPGFRTPDAVVLRLANFRSYDPESAARGMRNAGRKAEEVWRRFAEDPVRVRELVAAIRQAIERGRRDAPAVALGAPEPDEAEFPEGRLLFRLHRTRERHPALRARKMREAAAGGRRPACEVCGLVPELIFGVAGRAALECHHIRPLQAGERATHLADIALVCANCHRTLHAMGAFASLQVLRERVPPSFHESVQALSQTEARSGTQAPTP
jgi:5-methylcytosine-specific restriction protein A